MEKTGLILRRQDLIDRAQTKPIHDLNYADFRCSLKEIEEASVVLFVDNDKLGSTRIIKNRYGLCGILE